MLLGKIRFLQCFAVDVYVAVGKSDGVAAQADHALDQQLTQLLAAEHDDVAPCRGGVAEEIGQPPAQKIGFGGQRRFHGAGGHPGQRENYAQQE